MPTALITGITGQDGQYLAEFLHSMDYKVYGMVRGQRNPKAEIIRNVVNALRTTLTPWIPLSHQARSKPGLDPR